MEKVSVSKDINYTMFKQIMEDLHSYVSKVKDGSMKILPSEIPTAILLAGVNVPDHVMLFDKVVSTLESVTPYIATVSSKNCNNMKNMVEESIYQLINAETKDDPIIKKTHCTFRALSCWYQESNKENTPLVIIVRDFENFSAKALHDFVYNLSIYSTMKIVLIFGIATSLHVVHRTLSYDVTSKLRVKVFSTQTQLQSLSDALEGIIFSHKIPFKLTGNAFNLLQDIFLFYDLSVDGFMQAYKICLALHFFDNNWASLCCNSSDIEEKIDNLMLSDIQEFKKLPSIAHYFKGKEELNPKEFKKFLVDRTKTFQIYMHEFLSVLKCLHAFVATLTSAPLGKKFREIYGKAVSSNLTDSEEYKSALQLLKYLAKEELLLKLTEVIEVAKDNEKFLPQGFKKNLEKNFKIIQNASLEIPSPVKSRKTDSEETSPKSEVNKVGERLKRMAFVEDLRSKARKTSHSPYKEAQENLIDYLDRDIFSVYLKNPRKYVGHDIFCFHDSNLVKRQIKGSLRAAVHTALNDPRFYLKCDCCHVSNDGEILSTMPDLSIIYKLHLENRKLINMYDWLQSFLSFVDPSETEEQREVDPAINARFSQAVAELQFLGYIKGSKRKTDHVKRLT
ncbi:origin recognition complex subunit 3 isoform X2 [Belonocnema kinseyi]|uniref:origin recognition complex subunit 3 isoform X2 n=1 Tax=Belonocnema kinseyi TaxID=2817044 RepID=UPI00143CE38D|nr:origin recognition complex subunit 3 isoform X2 [Belonocnema kinseyi]